MDKLDLAILGLLIFPESFQSIVDECPIPTTKHIAADILKRLLHDDFVIPMLEDDKGILKRSLGYDSDFLNDYRYQITSKGFKVLEG